MTRPTLTDGQRDQAMTLLHAELTRLGNRAAVAARIGCNRSAVSMVLSGTYPASPDGVLFAALSALDQVACPYLGGEIERSYCVETNAGPPPTWDPSALSLRRACQTCPNYPQHLQQGNPT